MNSVQDTPFGVGCPIRRPRDHRSLASPPGFSQRAASFIASQCQGIHQMPFFGLDPKPAKPPPKGVAHQGSPPTGPFGQAPEPRRAQGQAPGRGTPPAKPVDPAAGARMKTLLRTGRPQALACARGPSASVTFANSLHPINQHNPRTPAKAAGRPASRRRPGPGAKPLSSPNAADHRRDAREPARRQRSDPSNLRRLTCVVRPRL